MLRRTEWSTQSTAFLFTPRARRFLFHDREVDLSQHWVNAVDDHQDWITD
jgi:hypothetical protein